MMKRYTGLSIGVIWSVLLVLALPVFVTRATHFIEKNEVAVHPPQHRLTISPRAYSLLRESARLAEPRLPAAVRQAVTFTLQSDKPSATVQAGQSAQFTISAKSPQTVRLSVFLEARNLPATTAATFVPRGIRPNDEPSRMTITTQPGTPPGTYQFEVVGTYAGSPRVVQTLPLTLVVTGAPVQDFTMSAQPTEQSARPGETVKFEIKTTGVNGYAGPITLQMPQLPAGITGELAPLTVQAGQFSTLILTTATPLAPQSHTWTITGSATMQNRTVTHDTSVTLTIIGSGHDFTVGATSTEATVTAGQSANYTITSTGLGGFTGPISLNVEGLPDGATFAFGQSSITAGSSTSLLITTPADLEAGTYPLTVTGTANIDAQPVTKSLTLMLTVEADTPEEPGDPTDFSLTTTQNTSVVVPPGGEGTITVISLPSGQFLSPIDLTAAGFPQGVTAQFEPSRIGPNGSSTLTIEAAASVPSGRYSFTITGTAQVEAQTLTHQIQLFFVVAGTETTTTITGVVMTAEDTPQPLAGVAVFQAQNPVNRVMTDDQGQFTLTNLPPDAHQSLIIDGTVLPTIPTTVSYPAVPLGFDVIPNTVHQVEGVIYLPQLHLEDQVPIEQNSPNEQILTNPRIPNLQVIIPPRTRVLNYDKTPLTHVWITKVRGDRMPFARPSGIDLSVVPEVYTIQPQSAALDNQFEIRFPNTRGAAPDEEFLFWRDNQETSALRIWGRGKVTPDGLQIIENEPPQPPEESSEEIQKPVESQHLSKQNELPVDFRPREIYGWFVPTYPCEGTEPPSPSAPQIVDFYVDPPRLDLFQGQSASLKAMIRYSDGEERDVTHLCTFSTWEGADVTVTDLGIVTAKTLECQDCVGAGGALVNVKLEIGFFNPILTQYSCDFQDNFNLARDIPIRIPIHGIEMGVESDYSPVFQYGGGAYILNGHPTIVKIRALPGSGSFPIAIYRLGEKIPDEYGYHFGPLRLVYEGSVNDQQEISFPVSDALFDPDYRDLRLTVLERGGNQCYWVGGMRIVKIPNFTVKVIPQHLPVEDPDTANPNNLVTVKTDALIQVQSDLPLNLERGQKLSNSYLYLLKNGKVDTSQEYWEMYQVNYSHYLYETPFQAVWKVTGAKIDPRANYEMSLTGWYRSYSNWWGYTTDGYYSHFYSYYNLPEGEPCRNSGVGWWGWAGYGYYPYWDSQTDCRTNYFNQCDLQLAATPVLFSDALVVDYHKRVTIRRENVDDTTCYSGGSYFARVVQPAHIKLTQYIFGRDKVLFDEDVPEGAFTHPVAPNVPTGQHYAILEATPLDGGPTETYKIELSVEEITNNVMPVGHTFVKGVDLADGHVVQSATDFVLPGRGLSLELSRTYSNVTLTESSPFGVGWSDSLHSRLVKMFSGDCAYFIVVGGDGQGQKFRVVDDDTFVAQRGYHSKLVKTPVTNDEPEGGYDFITKEGVIYHYKGVRLIASNEPEISVDPGNLQYIRDPNGNELRFTYDPGTGRLMKVTDASDRELEFHYSETYYGGYPRVERVTGPLNLEILYSYDSVGNLQSVQRGDRTWSYGYNQTELDIRYQHRLEKVRDPNGNETTYEYFTENEVFPGENINPPNCDFMEGNCTIVTARYKVNAVKKITEPGITPGGEPSITTFAYDYSRFGSAGAYKSTHDTVVTDPRQNTTTYVIDAFGAAIEIHQPGDIETSIKWNDGDVYKDEEIDANGRKTTYDHDAKGNLLEERVFTDDPDFGNQQIVTSYTYESKFNRLTSKTEAHAQGTPNNLLHKTTYNIDPDNGNLRSMTDALGHTTTFTYNGANGNLVQKRDSRGYLTTYHYDGQGGEFGKPTRIVEDVGNGNIITTINSYDDRSRLISSVTSFGRETTYTYDDLDHVKSITVVDNNPASSNSSQPSTVLFDYYPNGVLQKRTEVASGTTVEYQINGQNQPVTITESQNNFSFTSQIQYDPNGNQSRVIDRRGVVRAMEYDDLNRLTHVRIEGGWGATSNLVSRMTYDDVGNKLTETDMHGNVTSFVYDGLYRVRRKIWPETNPATGQPYRETFISDPLGNLVSYTDANGHTATMTYDRLSRKTSLTDAIGRQTTYGYASDDPSSNPSAIHDLTQQMDTVLEYDGMYRVTRRETSFPNLQGGSGRLTYTTLMAYDDQNHTMVETDPRGNQHFTQMDSFNRVYKQILDTTSQAGPSLNLTTYFHYDSRGNRITVTNPEGANDGDPNHTTVFEYDLYNRITRVTYPNNTVESMTYDGEGLVVSKTDANSVTTSMDYDPLGRLKVTRMQQPISSLLNCAVVQIPDMLTLSTVDYDDQSSLSGASHAVTVTDAVNRMTRQEMDRLGRTRRIVDGIGTADERMREFTYDGLNKRSETDWHGVGQSGNLYQFEYDDVNRLTRATDPRGKSVTTLYQDAQNLVTTTDKRGIQALSRIDALGRVTTMTEVGVDNTTIVQARNQYDPNSNLIRMTDAVNNVTAFEYDGVNRKQMMVRGFGTPLAATIEYGYDRRGNLTSVVNDHLSMAYTYDRMSRRKTATDGVGRITNYDYDNLNRVSSMTDPYGNQVSYDYDEVGALLKVTQPGMSPVEYRYDAQRRRVADLRPDKSVRREYDILGRVTRMDEYNPGEACNGGGGSSNRVKDLLRQSQPVSWAMYEYDANDLLKRLEDANGNVVTYSYDQLNRLKIKRYPNAAPGDFSPVVKEYQYEYSDTDLLNLVTEVRVDNSELTHQMIYDGLDRLESETDRYGKILQFSYYDNGLRQTLTDANGQTVNYGYDALNRLKSVSSPVGSAEFEYYSDDLLREINYPTQSGAQVVCNYDYDPAGRPANVHNRKVQSNQTISQYQLSYDDQQNVITLNETQMLNGSPETETQVFSFGVMNRLIRAQYGDYGVDYTYDNAGRRQTEIASGTKSYNRTYTYGDIGRLTQVEDSVSGTVITLDYDANGNMRHKTTTPQTGDPTTQEFSYDIRDNLRKVTNTGTGEVQGLYEYDHAGRRVRQESPSEVLHSTYDSDQLTHEWNATLQPASDYVWGNGQTLGRKQGLEKVSYLFNHLGSTADVVNLATNDITPYRYDAWGNFRELTPIVNNQNRLTFTGQYFDQSTGLYCFGQGTRFLDADLGIFTQKDPVYGDLDEPRSQSPYAYAWNNPVWYDDPTGMAVDQGQNGQKYTTSKTKAVSEYRRKNNREDVTDWDNGTQTSVYFPTDDELKDMNTTGNPSSGGGTSGRRNRSKKATETTGHTGYVTEPVTETRQPKPAKPEEEIDTQPGATGSQTPEATNKKNEPSSLTLRRGAETYGVDPNASYEGFDWYINAGKNAAARTGYDLWNLISFGALERQDTLTDQLDRRQISLDEYQEQSIVNFGVSGAQLGLTAATGAAGGALATAGVGTRVAAAGGITVAEKFAGESLEISTGFRREYSPWEQYALAGAFGSLFGAGPSKSTSTAYDGTGNLAVVESAYGDDLVTRSAKALAENRKERLIQLHEVGSIDEKEMLRIVAHGSVDGNKIITDFGAMTGSEFAAYLREIGYKKSAGIDLITCNTGCGSFGQELANALGVRVRAPLGPVNVVQGKVGVPQVVGQDGKLLPPLEGFREFIPK